MKIKIKYKLLSPLSHIGETASTGSYFNMITTSNGRVPVLTGNSVRGRLRDGCATHLLNSTGVKVDKDIFNVLYSGGNIAGTLKDDIGRAKLVREHFPMISLFGGGLDTMIMPGKLMVTFAYPICDETSEFTGEAESGISWRNLIDEIEFTRTDDSKNDMLAGNITDTEAVLSSKASTQMRYSVQYISAGTEFVQYLILMENVTDLEKGALLAGICEWFKVPVLGGMAAKGFGLFDATVGTGIILDKGNVVLSSEYQSLIDNYNEFIKQDNSAEWLNLLKGGGNLNGKKTDKAT